MRWHAAYDWFQRQPLKFLWGLVLLSAFVIPLVQRGERKSGEFYPFSNLPMYSRFSDSTYYVYVADLNDQPVAVTRLTGQVLSNLKKNYDTELKLEKRALGGRVRQGDLPLEARQRAGERVLSWLIPFAHAKELTKLSGLRLKEVTITYDEREGICKTTRNVGEVRVP